ncbi:unnamed protein product [Echinostoma caproni]|uniref:Uncharacterized protein n=1 Tax=Echinostoma caproni TaxID=27848 RepID=A0A3P8HLH6_9TREM|nr:unnamed protein product [Echinostoma caproni]
MICGVLLLIFWVRQSRKQAALQSNLEAAQLQIATTPQLGDRHLATSAQCYHFAHQKQQMISQTTSEEADSVDVAGDDGGDITDDTNSESVYEFPGLDMENGREVENPGFNPQSPQIPQPGVDKCSPLRVP